MATLFDGGLLQNFSGVFTFIFVYVLMYGMLGKAKLLGDGKDSLNALIAFCAAIFAVFSPTVVQLIAFMVPWLVIMVVVGFMIYMFGAYFGLKPNDGKGGGKEAINTTVMIIVIIIFVIGFAKFYNPEPDNTNVIYTTNSVTVTQLDNGSVIENQTTVKVDNRPEWFKLLLSPKILGIALFLAIAGYTIMNLGTKRTT